jgi:alpha-L-fucosidase 2
MVFGRTDRERIALNEDTLWSGGPKDWNNPEGREHLPEIRRLVLERKFGEAEQLVRKLQGAYTQSYQPLGDLRLEFADQGEVTDYERTLDIENATATVRYKIGDNRLRRTMFVSHPDQVIVVQLASEQRSLANSSGTQLPPRCGRRRRPERRGESHRDAVRGPAPRPPRRWHGRIDRRRDSG